MMRFFTVFIAVVLIVVPSAIVPAQQSGSHRVVVRFQERNEMNIGEPKNQTESSSASSDVEGTPSVNVLHNLGWTVNPSLKKVTVSADALSGESGLRIRAVDCSGCISSGLVAITPAGRDLVTMIDASRGGCGLEYSLDEGWRMSRRTGTYRIYYTITDAL